MTREARTNIVSTVQFNEEGYVTGGNAQGIGIRIDWQDGPLDPNGQNGAFIEGVIEAVVLRLQSFQETDLRCRENAIMITKLQEAMHWAEHRREDRKLRGHRSGPGTPQRPGGNRRTRRQRYSDCHNPDGSAESGDCWLCRAR